jgi:hypothetical protein
LAKATRKREKSGSDSGVHTIKTSAELFPDGSSIELVGSADGERLLLLHCNGKRTEIAEEVRFGGHVYQPLELHSSLRRALRFPTGIADFVDGGALFRELVDLQQEYAGVSVTAASWAATWDFTTWLADILPSPPPLVVSGIDLTHANKFFGLNRCLCRRALVLGDLSRQALTSLPMELRPTLMIARPDLSKKILSLCNASNYRNTFIPGRRGTVLDAACSKAFFIGTNASSHSIDHAIHVSLPPVSANLTPLDDRREKQIADKFQPQMFRYRVDFFRRLRESTFAKSEGNFSTGDFAGTLKSCLPNGPAVTERVGRLLDQEKQDRERRLSCDLGAVIIEVLWTKLQDPRADIAVARIAEFTDAILQSRGESWVYSAAELGWQLRDLGIPRHSGRNFNSVRFSRETWKRLHDLAQILGLRLPPHPDNCAYCALLQDIEK